MNTSQINALALRNAARWSSIGYEIPIVPDREEEKGRLTGHDKKRGGQRRKEWCKGEKREVTSETASSFEHPKKGNARTPVDLR